MINFLVNNRPNILTCQKSFVSYNFIPNAFKYCIIPITSDLRIVTQLIPRKDIDDSYCILSLSIVQYSNWSSLDDVLLGRIQNSSFKSEDVRILSPPVSSPVIDVSVVFKTSSDANKWNKRHEDLIHLLKDILSFYTFVNSCLITVPSQELNCNDIVYICVHNTCSKKSASRISSNTEVNIIQIYSLDRFKQQCNNHDSFKVCGLDNQLRFLDYIYTAHAKFKPYRPTNFIQKVLVIGPSGCGKTRLVKHFAKVKKCGLVIIEGSSLAHADPGKSESLLRSLFDEAVQRSREQPNEICLVLLDQIDVFCRKTKSTAFHLRRISHQLFHLLETINDHPGVIILATTNNIHALDPSIRQATRLEVEIYIDTPFEKDRYDILRMLGKQMRLKPSLYKKIAACTPGFLGADLALLLRDVNQILKKDSQLYRSESELLQLFMNRLTKQSCSALRGGFGVTRFGAVEMNSLGGLSSVKLQLQTCIQWPLTHPESFRRLGIPIPRGILLYGPPGCAKTSLACAVANATNINFLSVSAAELYSPYVGEAERNVIDLFHKARVNSPCIIFIDEIDALVGNRTSSSKNVQSKILSTFLTEMDGIGSTVHVPNINKLIRKENDAIRQDEEIVKTVIVIAATNRPDKLDSALLRPGRFDKLLCIALPDQEDRLDILQTITKQWKMPLADAVNLAVIAALTDRFTGADLKNLMNEAGYAALFENTESGVVKQEHILQSLKSVKSSVAEKSKIYEPA